VALATVPATSVSARADAPAKQRTKLAKQVRLRTGSCWASARTPHGAVGLTLDAATGIAEAGRAGHVKDGARWRVRRSLVVGGRLLTISDVGIERNSLASLAEEAWLAFP
jgi:hypothetical protein